MASVITAPRHGATIRKRVRKIYEKKKKKYRCPNCRKKALRWVAVGLWECRNCGFKMAGAAFEPKSDVHEKLSSLLAQIRKA